MMTRILYVPFIGAALLALSVGALSCNPFVKRAGPINEQQLGRISLPEGFEIEMYADSVPNARSMALGDAGTVFVGSRSAGAVYAILDRNKDGVADRVLVLDEDLNSPNGLAFFNGDLYVAEISRILRYRNVEMHLQSAVDPEVLYDEFPDDRHHGWKYIAFGPDDKLYVPVGAPCNICKPDKRIYASLTRMDPDGTNFEIFASGIRNTVGFDWHPDSGVLWFTDNGRDWMGDNLPPDELNRAPVKGMHFGYPYCHGIDTPDPEFGDKADCTDFAPPVQELGPHVAALGMLFYTGTMFPAEYRNRILIAEHGSWNRTTPIGYRVTMVELEGTEATSYSDFADGWLQGTQAWGRPVDLLQMDDGSILVSDDHNGVIYRISYTE